MTATQIAEILGVRSASRIAAHALAILQTPYDPGKSTAQPPIDCPHSRFQNTSHGCVCAVCGASPSAHAGFFKRRGLP